MSVVVDLDFRIGDCVSTLRPLASGTSHVIVGIPAKSRDSFRPQFITANYEPLEDKGGGA